MIASLIPEKVTDAVVEIFEERPEAVEVREHGQGKRDQSSPSHSPREQRIDPPANSSHTELREDNTQTEEEECSQLEIEVDRAILAAGEGCAWR